MKCLTAVGARKVDSAAFLEHKKVDLELRKMEIREIEMQLEVLRLKKEVAIAGVDAGAKIAASAAGAAAAAAEECAKTQQANIADLFNPSARLLAGASAQVRLRIC